MTKTLMKIREYSSFLRMTEQINFDNTDKRSKQQLRDKEGEELSL